MKYSLLTDILRPDTSTPPRLLRWRARFIAARAFGNGKWKIPRDCSAIAPPTKPRVDRRFQGRRRSATSFNSLLRIIEACQTVLSLMQHHRTADADEAEDSMRPKRSLERAGISRSHTVILESNGENISNLAVLSKNEILIRSDREISFHENQIVLPPYRFSF